MRFDRTSRALRLSVLALALAAVALPAAALVIPESPGRFAALVIPDPAQGASASALTLESAAVPTESGNAWKDWLGRNGKTGTIILDGRSGAPSYIETQGIPWVRGGRIVAAEGRTSEASSVSANLDTLADSLRIFATRNSSLLKANAAELVLNREGSGLLADDLWQVEFDREIGGIPVLGERYIFYIGHGNLTAFGASRWSPVQVPLVPAFTADGARSRLLEYMGLTSADQVDVIDGGTLVIAPSLDAHASELYAGPVGQGYRSALTYRMVLSVEGDPGTWVGYVDAQTGEILGFFDDNRYARIKGGIYPYSNDGICPSGCEQAGYPLPYAAMTVNGGALNASSAGAFSCSGGSASATLNGQYVRVVDTCGSISQSITCSNDLDFGVSSGTDCTVPAGGTAGDTHASRTSFYHLNRIKEHARAWLPANTWLPGNLTDNVNINNTCNAFWNSGGATGTVNFYRSGGGCRNTGEIAGVFLHEWGHGMDQNDGGGYDRPTEGYADITALLTTHVSCVGRGFQTGNCGGYGNACLACTGVREDDWNQRANHAPSTFANFGINCPVTGSDAVCGSRDGHCTAYIVAEAIWDLAVRDLPAAGVDPNTAWQIVDRLWYKSRTGSGGNSFTCTTSPVASNGCAATSMFNKLRTVDDEDGNLTNGTPNGAAIFAAFNRHLIACGAVGDASNQSTTSCLPIGSPTVTLTAGAGAALLSWPAVANATSYNVLRTDQGCGSGFTIVANVAGTSYTDSNLAVGFPEYYTVQPVGANAACFGALSTCQSVTPLAGTDLSAAIVDGPDPVTAGSNISYTITATNAGPDTAANAHLATSTPAGTTFVSLTPVLGWSCSSPAVGGTGSITCDRASFPASSSGNFTVVVKVNQCIGNGFSVGASATISSSTLDAVPANDTATAATAVNDPGTCSDGNGCTQGDTCVSGSCQSGAPVVCTASDQCHDAGVCNTLNGQCSNPAKPEDSPCDDSNACTGWAGGFDHCSGGACIPGAAVPGDDNNPCTDDICDPQTGIQHIPNTAPCEDGNPCTAGDTCSGGSCVAGGPAPPPSEVNSTLVVFGPGTGSTVSWTDGPGPFNVYRGTRTAAPWSYNQTCFASLVGGPVGDAGVPAVDETFFYLVSRALPACGTESVLGRNSAGAADPNSSPCP